jgi:LPS sulfotransferase NodH
MPESLPGNGASSIDAKSGAGSGPLRVVATSSYVICTNPRSGSWLLSDGLISTGVAGTPREWFNANEEQQPRWWNTEPSGALAFADYMQCVVDEATTPNGVCGIKVHFAQLAGLTEQLTSIEGYQDLAASAALAAVFPGLRYIWLTRRDKARQALSYARASQSSEWWKIDGVPPPRTDERSSRGFHFDPRALYGLEQILVSNDREWQSFFADAGAEPLVIEYETLAASYAATIRQVLRWLRIPAADIMPIASPRLQRQSSPHDEQWLNRYLRYRAQFAARGGASAHGAQTPPGEANTVSRRPVDADRASDGSMRSAAQTLSRRVPATVSGSWRQWIAEQLLQHVASATLVEVLVRNGHSRDLAEQELLRAAADPYLIAARHRSARLDKAVALLKTLHDLDTLRTRAGTLERCQDLSPEDFLDSYYAANRPVILGGLMADCRARQLWTPDYLKRMAGSAPAEIMAGRDSDPRYEQNPDRHRVTMPFADYVDLVCSGQVTNDYYLVANNRFLDRPEASSLLGDLRFAAGYLDPAAAAGQSFLWFGPAGTVTPLHHDACNLVVAQIRGRKQFRLIPATQWALLYDDDGFFSSVDVDKLLPGRSPGAQNISPLDAVLNPGEILFIPAGWSHHVRALDPSISVSATNFVFPNPRTW